MVWTRFAPYRFARQHQSVRILAVHPFQATGLTAYLSDNVVSIDRLLEPTIPGIFTVIFLARKKVEYVEHHRPGSASTRQAGNSLPLGVACPDSDGVVSCHSDRPRVPEPETGTCFPRHLLDRSDQVPVNLIRSVDLFQSVECPPQRAFVVQREIVQSVTLEVCVVSALWYDADSFEYVDVMSPSVPSAPPSMSERP